MAGKQETLLTENLTVFFSPLVRKPLQLLVIFFYLCLFPMAQTEESHVLWQSAFLTTHWSMVFRATEFASSHGQAALESLCRTYWYPLYACVRRKGYDPEEAKDLTQAFFARLLEKNYLSHA